MMLSALLVAAVKAAVLIRFFLSEKNSILFFPSCKLLCMEGDDEELSFVTLLAATKNVVQWLELNKKKPEHRERQSEAGNSDEQKGEQYRRDIDRELQKEGTVGK